MSVRRVCLSAYPPVCLPTRLCHWILTSATCRCRAGAVGRPPNPVGETIAIGWWIRRRHAVEHGRKPRSCSTAVLLLLQITRCQAGRKAGRLAGHARQRRNEAGRDPLDAAIFSPREYVSRVFGFVLSRLMGTIYCRLTAPENPLGRTLGRRTRAYCMQAQTAWPWPTHTYTYTHIAHSTQHTAPDSALHFAAFLACFFTRRHLLVHSFDTFCCHPSHLPSPQEGSLPFGSAHSGRPRPFVSPSFSTTPTHDPV